MHFNSKISSDLHQWIEKNQKIIVICIFYGICTERKLSKKK